MCTNYHGGGKYSTPQWVFLKGAKSHEFKGVKYKTPDGGTSDVHISAYFDDPIFMEEHEKFIKALAARYDGDVWNDFSAGSTSAASGIGASGTVLR